MSKPLNEIRDQVREIRKMKRHPGYWWNYLLFWLLSKGIIKDIKLINKIGWRKK